MKPETKYKGSIKLSAIGDALGWITEFEKNTLSLKEKFGTERIDKFYSWKKSVGGRFYGFIDNINAGSYSDDTQLLLAVARSIKNDGSLDHNYFAKIELPNWLDYARGGGRTVKTAADKISRKSVKWYNNFYNFKVNGINYDYKNSGANGAAMRVLPIALANIGDEEKIKEEIFCNSIITHGHPRAILGAMLYGYAINQIIMYRPEDFNWDKYITQIGTDFQNKFKLSFLDKIEIREWLKEWNKSNDKPFQEVYEGTLVETQNQLRFIFQSIKQDLTVKETLSKLGCFNNETKGSGIATVVAGIYLAAKFKEKPLDAVIEAVNAIGSDTDSIAAFAGGLIGGLHGQNIIPEKWKLVQDNEYLEKIAEDLLAISENRYVEQKKTAYTNNKLLNNPSNDDFRNEEIIEFIPLGIGKITAIERQPTLTKGKYNLLINAQFENGQSILVSKIFNNKNEDIKIEITSFKDTLLNLASNKLKPEVITLLKKYINKNEITDDLYNLLLEIIKNN
ncbi:ADP-ribosylglycohydrolase family protein [Flavobacterium urocaniciphilum]|uniref:ADP-ribosylglycohydrolase n=1 Tax=Flavobacterium urocaniciphilum TaxID=1299341 RepID=A0A1H9CU97_9FLAO|nr:ADP-ribosylglycohydrolase family protein [Flavobacterium urocaniciphilum]SEQ04729.1 ADP-ribosylglycohydrolase [Flavobacterium urocaniciphilum]